tara:strand:- start:1692 stop:1955 length:264 start_codon:yes stop_codon:yes gene_type:complete
MKKIIRKIVNWIIEIPNFPFRMMSLIYILVKVIKETGITEFSMTTKEDWDNNVELNNYIDNLYPPSLSYMIAFLFYTYIGLNIYLNN